MRLSAAPPTPSQAPSTWLGSSTTDAVANRPRIGLTLLLVAVLWTCAGGTIAVAQDARPIAVTVEAGSTDRLETPVSFDIEHAHSAAVLVDGSGRRIPIQQGPDGRYWFILDHLERGESVSFRFDDSPQAIETPIAAIENSDIAATATTDQVAFSAGSIPILTYNFTPTDLPDAEVDSVYRRGGYIHPVHTPNGVQLTDDYPPNHLHHHGIWGAWTKTEFEGRTPDFWNMGSRTGTVEPVALDSVWSGPVFSGLQARHAYIDLSAPAPVKAIDERWTIRVFPSVQQGYHVFDLIVEQTTADGATLHLPEYHYGGVGFRGHRQWNGADHTYFLTSEGKDRSDGHATRARWCHIGGYVDGKLAGMAILDHPGNFRSPQPMRIHPEEPFFNFAPSQLGDWSIGPVQVYTASYRFITYDGEPDPATIDRLWNDFADPPVAVVEYE